MATKSSNPVTPAPIPSSPATPEPGSDLASVFGDPNLTKAVSEDPVLKFIVNSWRQAFVVVLAAVAVFYAYNVFQETREQDIESAGDAFSTLQSRYSAFRTASLELSQNLKKDGAATDDKVKKEIEEQTKRKDESRKQLEDAITALADARAPYNRLATLYRGLVAKENGDSKILIGSISPTAWEGVSDLTSDDRFLSELEALAYARTLLDSADRGQEGRALLKKLGQSGAFVYLTAGLAFSSTAKTPEERSEALALIQQIDSSHPEQSALLTDELSRLKAVN